LRSHGEECERRQSIGHPLIGPIPNFDNLSKFAGAGRPGSPRSAHSSSFSSIALPSGPVTTASPSMVKDFARSFAAAVAIAGNRSVQS
jgi:hypothetical protein